MEYFIHFIKFNEEIYLYIFSNFNVRYLSKLNKELERNEKFNRKIEYWENGKYNNLFVVRTKIYSQPNLNK